jgi:DNA-binding transcriptional LysR family regulator
MLDPLLLRTFLVIAQGNSFSETSRKLSMRQSTVSDHVRRLEESLGRQLFLRDTHSVALTPEGEALIGFARTILETSERAERHFAGAKLRGRVRFGASEDLVLSWLPSVLKAFINDHPEIDLEFTIALSSTLIARHDAGDLDIVLCKRWPGDDRGEIVWRDEIVWAATSPDVAVAGGPVPLILYPPPSITRSIALAALGQAGVAWRIACTSDTLSGVVAATQAGLGVMVLSRKLLPPTLFEIKLSKSLPPLGSLDFILLRSARAPRAPVAELSAAIVAKGISF